MAVSHRLRLLGLPVRVHYFISICWLDGLLSLVAISRVSLMAEMTCSERERLGYSRLIKVVGVVHSATNALAFVFPAR